MGDLDAAFSKDNLHRAWRRLRMNSEATYKNYFRHIYKAFSIAATEQLLDLRDRLKSDLFSATRPTRLQFPKKSGLLRPWSLMPMEDQVVYQAMANVVADKLHPRIRHRYHRTVFGNLYAGKNSDFFFQDWRIAYRGYTDAMFTGWLTNGHRYIACFDLTSCYDSIDHVVLDHFMSGIGLDRDFCNRLKSYLGSWAVGETAMTGKGPLVAGHGLPQGPMASGLFAEVVLSHFDQLAEKGSGSSYVRYVDDIRILGDTERSVRKQLITLNLLSQEIGLFPQGSKTNIHPITDINAEVNTASGLPGEILDEASPPAATVRREILAVTRNLQISDETKFKYLCGKAPTTAELAMRLLRLVRMFPHLHPSVFRYLARFKRLPQKASVDAVKLLRTETLYAAYSAALTSALTGRTHPRHKAAFLRLCRKNERHSDPELRAAAFIALELEHQHTPGQLRWQLGWKGSWWFRATILEIVGATRAGSLPHLKLVDHALRDPSGDVALIAADLMLAGAGTPTPPVHDVHQTAQRLLKKAGVIGQVRSRNALVAGAMADALNYRVASVSWKKIMPTHLQDCSRRARRWAGYRTTDASAWVNLGDSIVDFVLDDLFRHDGGIGGYTLGSIGSSLNSPSRFATKYPKMFAAAKALHELRLRSDLSHPRHRGSGRPTRPIKFNELPPVTRLLVAGILEVEATW